jgi:hypothetical protein
MMLKLRFASAVVIVASVAALAARAQAPSQVTVTLVRWPFT